MSEARLHWHDHRYFPYELDLARREVRALLGGDPQEQENVAEVRIEAGKEPAISRLTYFKGIEVEASLVIPDQARLEASGTYQRAGMGSRKTTHAFTTPSEYPLLRSRPS